MGIRNEHAQIINSGRALAMEGPTRSELSTREMFSKWKEARQMVPNVGQQGWESILDTGVTCTRELQDGGGPLKWNLRKMGLETWGMLKLERDGEQKWSVCKGHDVCGAYNVALQCREQVSLMVVTQ